MSYALLHLDTVAKTTFLPFCNVNKSDPGIFLTLNVREAQTGSPVTHFATSLYNSKEFPLWQEQSGTQKVETHSRTWKKGGKFLPKIMTAVNLFSVLVSKCAIPNVCKNLLLWNAMFTRNIQEEVLKYPPLCKACCMHKGTSQKTPVGWKSWKFSFLLFQWLWSITACKGAA